VARIGIQALGGSTDIQPEEIANYNKDLLSHDSMKIPWTIENRYYSADVHFAVHPMRGLAPYMLQNVPAIIFVWESNKVNYNDQYYLEANIGDLHCQAYKHHVERIFHDLGGYEPEVSLAVRVKASLDVISGEEEAEEDNASIDEFVSRFRFEYVDATLEEKECRDNDKFNGRL